MRKLLSVLTIVLGLVAPVGAGTVFPMAPEQYKPGQTFELSLALPEMADLASYSIDLLVESDEGEAGIDFGVQSSASADGGYVFSTRDNFLASISADSPSTHRLTLSDFVFSNVDVFEGENQVAKATVFTAATHTAPLRLSINGPTLELKSAGFPGEDIPNFAAVRDQVLLERVVIQAIPEPATVSLILLGLVSTNRRSRP